MTFFANFLEWPRPFCSQVSIRTFLRDQHLDANENYLTAEALVIFESSSQHTWLVATNIALYCIFDWLKNDNPSVVWRIAKDEIVRNNRITLSIDLKDKSRKNGYVIINAKPPRLYTKSLFSQMPIDQEIMAMLAKAFEISSLDSSGSK
jgi:hypothetical protein